MKRSALCLLAALLLVVLPDGVAVASPPATPQITDVAAGWGLYEWDDGVTRCTLIADARLDPGYTKGQPVFAHAYAHFMWIGEGGGTWQDFNYWNLKLSRGDTSVHTYTAFSGGDQGYYIVDRVRYELTSVRGTLLSSMEISTANTCENAPG